MNRAVVVENPGASIRLDDRAAMSNELQDAVTLAEDYFPKASEPMSLAESTLETAISVAHTNMLLSQRAGDIGGLRLAQEEMLRLIGQRTPAQVERMERARGLRA
jgi:hypothetical protein